MYAHDIFFTRSCLSKEYLLLSMSVHYSYSSYVMTYLIALQIYFFCNDYLLTQQWLCQSLASLDRCVSGIFLWIRPANEKWHYIVTSSLIVWVHTPNDPCVPRLSHLPLCTEKQPCRNICTFQALDKLYFGIYPSLEILWDTFRPYCMQENRSWFHCQASFCSSNFLKLLTHDSAKLSIPLLFAADPWIF